MVIKENNVPRSEYVLPPISGGSHSGEGETSAISAAIVDAIPSLAAAEKGQDVLVRRFFSESSNAPLIVVPSGERVAVDLISRESLGASGKIIKALYDSGTLECETYGITGDQVAIGTGVVEVGSTIARNIELELENATPVSRADFGVREFFKYIYRKF